LPGAPRFRAASCFAIACFADPLRRFVAMRQAMGARRRARAAPPCVRTLASACPGC
jgi:hypothetical protein